MQQAVIPDSRADSEWLITNGLGGFASATVSGTLRRRYHGYLIAALPPPVGRAVMLSGVTERIIVDQRDGHDTTVGELTKRPSGAWVTLETVAFRLEHGLPVWTLAAGAMQVEKRAVMPHGNNTIALIYRLLAGRELAPFQVAVTVAMRRLEDPVSSPLGALALRGIGDGQYEISESGQFAPLRLWCDGGKLESGHEHVVTQWYASEASRGYDASGELWCPGAMQVALERSHRCLVVASTEEWDAIHDLTADGVILAEERRRDALTRLAGNEGPLARAASTSADRRATTALVFSADQFLISTPRRSGVVGTPQQPLEADRTVIAGYHWFTAWGRDTMISLEGLALIPGRHADAATILRTFAQHARRGLIPNLFPEAQSAGLYNTADATLWFVHALHRYLVYTGDRELLHDMLPLLIDIVAWHVRGTDFNIAVDQSDGLLSQGMDGVQLTWMDAKVGDWVVTPRRGKAVEIEGLWYNALRLVEGWIREADGDAAAQPYEQLATASHHAFNDRFWFAEGGFLYDVVDGPDGPDASCRPNQLLAFSLEHPVLDRASWRAVLDIVTARLLTPVGLRSLAPGSPGYHPRYDGDVRARDAAYHQGTVWPWLIGPYVDAWTRVHGRSASPRRLLDGLVAQLRAGLGQIPEIFDAEAPYRARGCIAQAWSVAEVIRSLAATQWPRSRLWLRPK